MSRYNHKCPVCGSVVVIGHVSVYCGTPIEKDGWTITLSDKDTAEKATYSCPKCKITVPATWVFKEMSETDAKRLMEKWGASPYSIHNQGPLPKEDKCDTDTSKTGTSESSERDSKKRSPRFAKREAAASTSPKKSTPSGESSSPAPEGDARAQAASEDSIFT